MLKLRSAIVGGSLSGLVLGCVVMLGGCDGPSGPSAPPMTEETVAKQKAATEANIAASKAKKK